MALYLNTNHVLLLALVLLVPATSLAQDRIARVQLTVRVGGELRCTPDGNPLPGAGGAANATVTVGCGNIPNIAVGVTNGQGAYNISANVSGTVAALATANKCAAIVQLPVTACRPLNRRGSLVAQLGFRNITNAAINLAAGNFVFVNATI